MVGCNVVSGKGEAGRTTGGGGGEHGAPMPVCTRAVIARPPPWSVSTQGNSPHARHVMEAVVRAAWMTQPCLSSTPGTMTSRK